MKTKTTVVIAALAIALAAAFAAWQETATIIVNAQTGYIDLDFTEVEVTYSSPYVDADIDELSGSLYPNVNDGEPSVKLVIKNAYPGAEVKYKITAYNDGTIPVNIMCSVDAPQVLTVTISPSEVKDLKPGESVDLIVTVVAGDVEEESEYEATVSCTYSQAVP
ncbi:MAG: NEW3 domain-containing protein [Pyrobaculum sp.]